MLSVSDETSPASTKASTECSCRWAAEAFALQQRVFELEIAVAMAERARVSARNESRAIHDGLLHEVCAHIVHQGTSHASATDGLGGVFSTIQRRLEAPDSTRRENMLLREQLQRAKVEKAALQSRLSTFEGTARRAFIDAQEGHEEASLQLQEQIHGLRRAVVGRERAQNAVRSVRQWRRPLLELRESVFCIREALLSFRAFAFGALNPAAWPPQAPPEPDALKCSTQMDDDNETSGLSRSDVDGSVPAPPVGGAALITLRAVDGLSQLHDRTAHTLADYKEAFESLERVVRNACGPTAAGYGPPTADSSRSFSPTHNMGSDSASASQVVPYNRLFEPFASNAGASAPPPTACERAAAAEVELLGYCDGTRARIRRLEGDLAAAAQSSMTASMALSATASGLPVHLLRATSPTDGGKPKGKGNKSSRGRRKSLAPSHSFMAASKQSSGGGPSPTRMSRAISQSSMARTLHSDEGDSPETPTRQRAASRFSVISSKTHRSAATNRSAVVVPPQAARVSRGTQTAGAVPLVPPLASSGSFLRRPRSDMGRKGSQRAPSPSYSPGSNRDMHTHAEPAHERGAIARNQSPTPRDVPHVAEDAPASALGPVLIPSPPPASLSLMHLVTGRQASLDMILMESGGSDRFMIPLPPSSDDARRFPAAPDLPSTATSNDMRANGGLGAHLRQDTTSALQHKADAFRPLLQQRHAFLRWVNRYRDRSRRADRELYKALCNGDQSTAPVAVVARACVSVYQTSYCPSPRRPVTGSRRVQHAVVSDPNNTATLRQKKGIVAAPSVANSITSMAPPPTIHVSAAPMLPYDAHALARRSIPTIADVEAMRLFIDRPPASFSEK